MPSSCLEKEGVSNATQLEEANVALKVLLQTGADEQKELEESILANMKLVVMPYLEKIKKSRLTKTRRPPLR